jgi:hypothetical protein
VDPAPPLPLDCKVDRHRDDPFQPAVETTLAFQSDTEMSSIRVCCARANSSKRASVWLSPSGCSEVRRRDPIVAKSRPCSAPTAKSSGARGQGAGLGPRLHETWRTRGIYCWVLIEPVRFHSHLDSRPFRFTFNVNNEILLLDLFSRLSFDLHYMMYPIRSRFFWHHL